MDPDKSAITFHLPLTIFDFKYTKPSPAWQGPRRKTASFSLISAVTEFLQTVPIGFL